MDAEKFSEYFDNAPVFYGERASTRLCVTTVFTPASTWASIPGRYSLHTSTGSQLPPCCHHNRLPDPHDPAKRRHPSFLHCKSELSLSRFVDSQTCLSFRAKTKSKLLKRTSRKQLARSETKLPNLSSVPSTRISRLTCRQRSSSLHPQVLARSSWPLTLQRQVSRSMEWYL